MIEQQFTVTSESLDKADIHDRDIAAVVVTADLRLVDSISSLKRISEKLNRIRKRVFVIDQRNRLSVVQAYALGATDVLINPITKAQLLAKLIDHKPRDIAACERMSGGAEAARAGAASLASMFSAVSAGNPVDVRGAKDAASKIADSIAEDGLSDWLTTVRRHHEGTYQHCLLVTGIAVDFGLNLGLGNADIERLHSAAIFHDIGKARIPLAVLDKPARLDDAERALIEIIGTDRDGEHVEDGFEEEVRHWRTSTVLDERARLAAEYAERYAEDHHGLEPGVDPDFWDRMFAHYTQAEVVELTMCLGSWLAFGRLNRVLGLDVACVLPSHPQRATS